jgi:hypothetical protein
VPSAVDRIIGPQREIVVRSITDLGRVSRTGRRWSDRARRWPAGFWILDPYSLIRSTLSIDTVEVSRWSSQKCGQARRGPTFSFDGLRGKRLTGVPSAETSSQIEMIRSHYASAERSSFR